MKKLVFLVLFFLPFLSFSQEYIDDSNFDDKISEQSAFGDDESSIVVVEFWAKFNEVNAFADWNKVEGVNYYRVDIAKAPSAKKEYRVRMAPTIIIFKDGIKEESFKAGLDLECPVTLDELIEAIEEVKTANQF
jgi:thioredoxin-like negative regulator of GroEL